MTGRVLIIAGSDSGGGAGIQADIKTVGALGGYAATAITALTAQDTCRVHAVFGVDPDFVALQIKVVLQDLGADAVKIGMLATSAVIEAVADALVAFGSGIPVVVDPVMVAKGGDRLLTPDAMAALTARLLPLAAIVTPNLREAETIAGMPITDADALHMAGQRILGLGPRAVLAKGGHLAGDTVTDWLIEAGGSEEAFRSPRVDTRSTHGTGCTLASAVATGLAQDLPLRDAVVRARAYLDRALRTAPGLGRGHGPLNHSHTVTPFPSNG